MKKLNGYSNSSILSRIMKINFVLKIISEKIFPDEDSFVKMKGENIRSFSFNGENIRSFSFDFHPLVLKYHSEDEIKNNFLRIQSNSDRLWREEDRFVNNVTRFSNLLCVAVNVSLHYFDYESLHLVSVIAIIGSLPIHHYIFRIMKVKKWI